jgi:hypothetical protein
MSVCTVNYLSTHGEIQKNPTYNILQKDGRSMTALPPVITQQYASATFLSTHFLSGKEIFGTCRTMKFSFLNIFKVL